MRTNWSSWVDERTALWCAELCEQLSNRLSESKSHAAAAGAMTCGVSIRQQLHERRETAKRRLKVVEPEEAQSSLDVEMG
jgi:hypothetical protein